MAPRPRLLSGTSQFRACPPPTVFIKGAGLYRASTCYTQFRRAVKRASENDPKGYVRLGDFRKTYLSWLRAAGVERLNQMVYLSHVGTDTTGRFYEMRTMDAFIKA